MSASQPAGSETPPAPDATLDWVADPAQGAVCALLTPAIKRALGPLAGGQTREARLRGDMGDISEARADIAAWARLAGHDLLAMVEDADGTLRVFLRKKQAAE